MPTKWGWPVKCRDCGADILVNPNTRSMRCWPCQQKRGNTIKKRKRAAYRATLTCLQCGAALDAQRSTRSYCSNACRQKAYRHARAA
jgi:hypothetical protein